MDKTDDLFENNGADISAIKVSLEVNELSPWVSTATKVATARLRGLSIDSGLPLRVYCPKGRKAMM